MHDCSFTTAFKKRYSLVWYTLLSFQIVLKSLMEKIICITWGFVKSNSCQNRACDSSWATRSQYIGCQSICLSPHWNIRLLKCYKSALNKGRSFSRSNCKLNAILVSDSEYLAGVDVHFIFRYTFLIWIKSSTRSARFRSRFSANYYLSLFY